MTIVRQRWARAIVAFVLAGTACGIPSTSYLPPVSPDTIIQPIGGETDFFFDIPDNTNANIFEGFEIYYKFFSSEDEDAPGVEGDASLPSPVSLQSLISSGYSRLADSREDVATFPDYPLIPLAEILTDPAGPADGFTIELNFSNEGSSLPSIQMANDITTQFSRSLYATPAQRQLKGFSPSDFLLNDSDLPPEFNPQANFDISIALYVLGYGNDYTTLSFNIHSVAAYLGSSKLILNQ